MQNTPIKDETQQKHYEVDVRLIKELNRNGGNIRIDYGKNDGTFNELVESIRENGIKNPLRAYRDQETEDGWILIDGHRRLAAAMVLVGEGATIRAKVISVDARKVTDEQLIIDMVTTNTGKPLSPLELCEAVRRLMVLNWTTKEIATKFAMKEYAIKNLDLLGSAPKRIRELIANNKLSYTIALDFLKRCENFNQALEKIEEALGKTVATRKISVDDDTPPIEEPITLADKEGARITRTKLNEVMNKVDSSFELRKVFKELIDKPQFDIINPELYSFCKNIVDNRYTAKEIKQLLIVQQ